MSDPINDSGYERIRRLVNVDLSEPNQWEYLEAQEDDGTIVWRGSTTGEWTTSATDQVQVVEITVTGQDVIDHGESLPVTITTSILKDGNTDSDDELANDSFEDATLADADDGVAITHEVEVPQL